MLTATANALFATLRTFFPTFINPPFFQPGLHVPDVAPARLLPPVLLLLLQIRVPIGLLLLLLRLLLLHG